MCLSVSVCWSRWLALQNGRTDPDAVCRSDWYRSKEQIIKKERAIFFWGGGGVAACRNVTGHSMERCALCKKTAELQFMIDMPFWTKTRVGPRNHVLDGGADPPR